MEKRVHLKGRLLKISECIDGSEVLVDVGCDHGRLCVSLLQTGRAKKAYATDISAPSLKKALILRDKCGLQECMKVYVADGLNGLDMQPDSIIIAGMGGQLISQILEQGAETAHNAELIVMQPMRGISELRRYLHTNGYSIKNDLLCKEAGRIYQVICAKYTGNSDIFECLPNDFYEIGDLMVKNNDPLLVEYIDRMINEIVTSLKNAAAHNIELCEHNKQFTDLKEVKKRLEGNDK